MRICVFGAGAIGGHLALRLARGGADVSVVVRGAHLAAIRQGGMRVRAPEGELHATMQATDDPAELGPQDAVLVTVKAPALPQVAATIAPLLGPDTPVLFVGNGIPWWYFHAHGSPLDGRRLPRIDPDDAIWNAVGPQRAIGGSVYAPSAVIAPGIVQVERPGSKLTLGEPDGTLSARAQIIADVLCAGGLDTEVTPDIRTAVWDKLLGNLATGPLAVLTQSTYRDFLAEPVCREAAVRSVEEGYAVARALGRSPHADHAARVERSAQWPHKASSLQDLELGRPMEIDAIYGAAVDLARMANVPTPTLDLLAAMAKLRARAAGLYPG